MGETIISLMELIGTIAFAVSGALVGVSCNLDIFGVVFVGIVTAVGGGMLRDVLIDRCPPAIFFNEHIFIIAALTAITVFIIAYINKHHFSKFREKIERINNIFDAVGLSAFTVTGSKIACNAGFSENILLVILMGMLTGIGGGIFRDVLVSKTPYVFKKHIYALASIAGGLAYYILSVCAEREITGTITAMVIVFATRMLATGYHWKLPKINIEEDMGCR